MARQTSGITDRLRMRTVLRNTDVYRDEIDSSIRDIDLDIDLLCFKIRWMIEFYRNYDIPALQNYRNLMLDADFRALKGLQGKRNELCRTDEMFRETQYLVNSLT